MSTKKYTDHNGKEVRVSDGKNVRISANVYDLVSKHALKKGFKIGKYFEMAAMDRMLAEKSKPFVAKVKP